MESYPLSYYRPFKNDAITKMPNFRHPPLMSPLVTPFIEPPPLKSADI